MNLKDLSNPIPTSKHQYQAQDDGRAVLLPSAVSDMPAVRVPRIQQCTSGDIAEETSFLDILFDTRSFTCETSDQDRVLHQATTRPQQVPLKTSKAYVDLKRNEPGLLSPTSPGVQTPAVHVGPNISGISFDLLGPKKKLLNEVFDKLTFESNHLTQFEDLGVQIVKPEAFEDPPDYDGKKLRPKSGKVLHADISALMRLLSWESDCETTGIILSEDITPSKFDTYEEGKDFQVLSNLGQGSFGTVLLAEDRHTKSAFVLKQQTKGKLHREEVSVPLHLSHPGISRILGLIWRGDAPEILMDFAGYSLDKIAASSTSALLTEEAIIDIGRQGFDVLDYMRQRDIIHLDVKPQNLCVQWTDGKFLLKFCDFGACTSAGRPLSNKGWTPVYMSPEQCRYALANYDPNQKGWSEDQTKITSQVDLYAFCCTLVYMCYWQHCLHHLLQGKNSHQIILHIAYNPTVMRRFVQEDWDPRLKTVLLRAFCADPKERILPSTAGEILNGPGPKAPSRGRGRPRKTVNLNDKSRKRRKRVSIQRMSCESAPGPGTEDMDIDSVPTPCKQTHQDSEPMMVDSPGDTSIVHATTSENLGMNSTTCPDPTALSVFDGNIPDLEALLVL